MLKKLAKNCYLREKDNLANEYSMVESDNKINFIFTNEYTLNAGGQVYPNPVSEIVIDKDNNLFIISDVFDEEENKDIIIELDKFQVIVSIINNTIHLAYYESVLRNKNITIRNIVFGDNHADIYAYLGTELMTVHHIAEVTGGDTNLLLNKCAVVAGVYADFPHSFNDIEGIVVMTEGRYYSDIELTPSTILLFENNHLYLKDVFAHPESYEFTYRNNLIGVKEKGKTVYTYNGEVCNVSKEDEGKIYDLISSVLKDFEESLNQDFDKDDITTAELIIIKFVLLSWNLLRMNMFKSTKELRLLIWMRRKLSGLIMNLSSIWIMFLMNCTNT
jgi:hypothetical protein